MLTKICIGLLLTVALYGCGPAKESITDLREYFVDGMHVIVGVKQTTNGKTTIKSFDGALWDIPEGVTVTEQKVSLESFKRVTN